MTSKLTYKSLLVGCLLAWSSLAFASVPLGVARKGADGHYDWYGCMYSNDYFIVNFSAYQVDKNAKLKQAPALECIDLPKTGTTQIAIDMLDLDVRKKPVGMKILSAEGQIIHETPMAVPKNGVLSTEVNFKQAGRYRIVIAVNDEDLKIPAEQTQLEIPLTAALAVESPAARSTVNGMFILLGVIIALCVFLVPRFLKFHKPAV